VSSVSEVPAVQYLTPTEAAKLIPGRPHTCSVWRWCVKGVVVPDGTRLRLQHVRTGSRIVTTCQWIADFGRKLAELKNQTL
jgi:hypothetical protein